MSYRELEVWKLAREAVISIHLMTLHDLPKFEMYEMGSQIRRSVKSIKSNIVEGYGRRRYKMDFIRHLTYAHASCDETIDHLETMRETGSLANEDVYRSVAKQLDDLGRKLNRFLQSVEEQHHTFREESCTYQYDQTSDPRS